VGWRRGQGRGPGPAWKPSRAGPKPRGLRLNRLTAQAGGMRPAGEGGGRRGEDQKGVGIGGGACLDARSLERSGGSGAVLRGRKTGVETHNGESESTNRKSENIWQQKEVLRRNGQKTDHGTHTPHGGAHRSIMRLPGRRLWGEEGMGSPVRAEGHGKVGVGVYRWWGEVANCIDMAAAPQRGGDGRGGRVRLEGCWDVGEKCGPRPFGGLFTTGEGGRGAWVRKSRRGAT